LEEALDLSSDYWMMMKIGSSNFDTKSIFTCDVNALGKYTNTHTHTHTHTHIRGLEL